MGAKFSQFLNNNGIKHTTSAPYHPASNGLAERAVKTFKAGMRKMTEGSLRQKLARFLFSYRTTPHSTTGVSPAELLMNRKLKSVLDLLNPRDELILPAKFLEKWDYESKEQNSRKIGGVPGVDPEFC